MGRLALTGGSAVRTRPFPSWPVSDEREVEAVTQVVRSGKWWYGEKVREFEAAFAAFQGATFGVSATSGTTALEIALLACGVGAGDEVIVPPYTFMATASAVLRVNGVPVFADIDLATSNLDPSDVEQRITDRTKAIIPVHFGGLPVDMDAFSALASRHGLRIIEDACHSWGSQWRGKGTGALGDCGVFSFQMSKNITSGEGGIMLTDNEELADQARGFSNCGRSKTGGWYEHFLLGSNLRMTELQAALLLVQLSRLEEQTERRQANARLLNRRLAAIPGIALIDWDDPRVTRRSYHIYAFRFLRDQWGGVTRDRFLEALNAEGIPSSAGYPIPLYKNPLFQRQADGPAGCPVSCPYYQGHVDYTQAVCPNAETLCEEACWIFHQILLGDASDMDDIAGAIEKVWEHRSELAQAF
ncbi:MAG TPA: DegT/DnrJ/EryC1/StrS family aminotransferase [Armatimonadota bacterium]|nr:DegT/DnrJ/EryC1/StrS family aminotransferase [Armatimonadota bacterium]HQK93847.1 DegT/DnrJ/EryC1/StrS family aminotransferase [Armatimonadota bacterium]